MASRRMPAGSPWSSTRCANKRRANGGRPVSAPSAAAQGPDCRRCAAYFITHDPAFPYGCRVLGFRSRGLPGKDVLAASGAPCRGFVPKAGGGRG